METIICTSITALAGIVGTYLGVRKSKISDQITSAERDQKLEDRLKTVEGKLDEHNGYAKRFQEIQVAIVKINKDIEYMRKDHEKWNMSK